MSPDPTLPRFARGDRDKLTELTELTELTKGADGSREVLFAYERSGDEWVSNWPPVPAEGFVVTLRLHSPRDDAATQHWTAPAAVRLDYSSFVSAFFRLRTAWCVRSSFSISAKRTWPSPPSPKPTPGLVATSAFSMRNLENSSEFIAR